MTNSEINEFISKKYSDEIESQEDENIITSSLKKIGVIPQTVYADTKSNYSESKCFKKTIILSQSEIGVYTAHVTIYFRLLTNPGYRKKDTAFVYFEGADIIDNSNAFCVYNYIYNQRWRSKSSDPWYYYKGCKNAPKSINYTNAMKSEWGLDFNSGSYAYAVVDLADDWTYCDDGTLQSLNSNHIIIMQMDIKKDESTSLKYVQPQVRYYHQQTYLQIDPAISVNIAGGISFQAKLVPVNHALGEVLHLTHYWK